LQVDPSPSVDNAVNDGLSTTEPGVKKADAAYAFATLLFSDNYVPGAVTLGAALSKMISRSSRSRRVDMVCMVTAGVSERARAVLIAAGWTHIVPVEQLDNPHQQQHSGMLRKEWKGTYTKLHAWELISYRRVIFVDADMMVIGSGMLETVNHHVLALFDNPELSMAPDCCDKYNSGLMVLQPSMSTFNAMILAAPKPDFISYDGGDQGFLNVFFENRISRIPSRFNAEQRTLDLNPHAWSVDDLFMIHFSYYKPWKRHNGLSATLTKLHGLWKAQFENALATLSIEAADVEWLKKVGDESS
jgi:alpha-N-acetylglucosamine transferase